MKDHPYQIELARECFRGLSALADASEKEEFFSEAVDHLTDEAFGELLLQLIGRDGDLPADLKATALAVAEILGPDHAQSLYRFAVLVTKLA